MNIHGWLILDKPVGISSARAVADVKRFLKPLKIGHAGTLDPLASGVLPLALGEATKTVSYVMDHLKAYQFTVRWGEKRTTADAAGDILETSESRPEERAIKGVLPEFIGNILQTPPAYSAIKVQGRRAYAMARDGEEVTLAAREVQIHKLSLISIPSLNEAVFSVLCGKGTYVRALAEDIAHKLGTVGFVSQLRRTQVGKFTETHTISLDKIAGLGHSPPPDFGLLPVESVLDDIPAFEADLVQTQKLKQGQAILLNTKGEYLSTIRAMYKGKLVALGEASGSNFKPVRVFNY